MLNVSQAYVQAQAQADKRVARQLFELARSRVSSHFDQYQLCGIICVEIKSLPQKIWVDSFKVVNLHPDFRISFEKWVEQINDHIKTGETAYTRKNLTIFDAMPGFWKLYV